MYSKLFQGSWKEQLLRKFKNMRRPNPSSTAKRSADEDASTDHQDKENLPPTQPKKKRRNCKELVADDVTESTYEVDVATLLQEMGKENPSKSLLKNLMDKTLAQRRKWIKTELPQVEQILEIFPVLKRAHTL